MQKNDKYTQARTLASITKFSRDDIGIKPLPTVILKLKNTLENGRYLQISNQTDFNNSNGKSTTPSINEKDDQSFVELKLEQKINEIYNEWQLKNLFNKDIIIFGGCDPRCQQSNDNQGKSVLVYNSRTNKWDHLTSMPGSRHHHSAVICKDKIYVIGGTRPAFHRQKPNITPTVWSFDPFLLQWCNEKSLPFPRRDFGLISNNYGFYVVGGEEHVDKLPVSSTYFYDINIKSWITKTSLNVPRSGLMVTLVSNNKFWAAGGIVEKEGSYVITDTIEEYNMDLDTWTKVGVLTKPRCYGKLCCVNKSGLYLVGGVSYERENKKLTSLTSIEKYMPEKKCWIKVGDMSVPRHGHDVITVHDKIIIFGGVSTDNQRAYSTVECFSTRTNKLIEGIVPLPYPTSGLCTIIMDKLSETDSNQSRGFH